MRVFNTSGPCDPEIHYTVMREGLVALGSKLVEEGRYFTIFAPRQAGKTTYFQLLFRHLPHQTYTPVWISFESLRTIERDKFYRVLGHELLRALTAQGIHLEYTVSDQVDLQGLFEAVRPLAPGIVLVIDEFEDVPSSVMSELLHAFRKMYHQKQYYALHALALVGVGSLAELVVSSASPFNIVDELQIPYFSRTEVEHLIGEYVSDSGQNFRPEVVRAIYDNTQGQPGLVCALCHHLITVAVPDPAQPVTQEAFYATLRHFLTERLDKNILNVVQKAREKQSFMLRLLFDDNPIPFTVDDADIAYLHAHGVVDNVDGFVEIPVPLYSKRLITAFRPLINGESAHYVSAHDNFSAYASADELNLHAILEKYRDYVRRRGFRAFDTQQLREGAWHYSLDGFITFFLEALGGETLIEVPTGRGRTDILILFGRYKYIIETKVFVNQARLQQGKRQLAEYLHSEQLDEGYYVVFSAKHSPDDSLFFDEVIAGKRIYTHIIQISFDPPSQLRSY